MKTKGILSLALCITSFALGNVVNFRPLMQAEAGPRIFEMRMYTVEDGKVELLSRVFREHVTKMFARHGMTNVAYFIPKEEPRCSTFSPKGTILSPAFDNSTCQWSKDTLIYILGHESRSAADRNWASFRKDAGGMKNFREEYNRAGVKVMKIESVFMDAAQYSALK